MKKNILFTTLLTLGTSLTSIVNAQHRRDGSDLVPAGISTSTTYLAQRSAPTPATTPAPTPATENAFAFYTSCIKQYIALPTVTLNQISKNFFKFPGESGKWEYRAGDNGTDFLAHVIVANDSAGKKKLLFIKKDDTSKCFAYNGSTLTELRLEDLVTYKNPQAPSLDKIKLVPSGNAVVMGLIPSLAGIAQNALGGQYDQTRWNLRYAKQDIQQLLEAYSISTVTPKTESYVAN